MATLNLQRFQKICRDRQKGSTFLTTQHSETGFKTMRQRGRAPGAAPSDARSHGSDDTSTTGNGSSSTDDGTSDGSRELRRDDDVLVVSCTIVYDHRFVRLRIAAHDTIESLVELTEIKLRKKYPNESPSHAIVGLRSQRLEKGAKVCTVERRTAVSTDPLDWIVCCVYMLYRLVPECICGRRDRGR